MSFKELTERDYRTLGPHTIGHLVETDRADHPWLAYFDYNQADRVGFFESLEDAEAWLMALNDVRLALGAMLGIDADGPPQLPPSDPMAGHMDIYHWLTVMQELLVLALMGNPTP